MNFQPDDEPKAGTASTQVDVLVEDLDAGVERVVELGGNRHRRPGGAGSRPDRGDA
jgi:hypothetical protein